MNGPGRRRHVLDRWVRRVGGGRLLIGGSPGRRVRLSPAGREALDRLLAGEATPADDPLRNRLSRHGMLHPVADPGQTIDGPITFVIPNRDGGAALAALVARLRQRGVVIVVDDGSSDGSAEAAGAAGATVIVNEGRRGPAGGRNTGLQAATSDWIAFLDADCLSSGDWAAPLAALLREDPPLAVVAPRVRSTPGAGAIAHYERRCSPLDMGHHPCRCGMGRRIPYVPSAALVARRSALLDVGGFDEDLRFGEDVDLCFRLYAHGWSVRYSPELEVEHHPRPSLLALAVQRFHYGCSAATLDRRHPASVSPLIVSRHTAAVLGAAAVGGTRSTPTGVATGTLAGACSGAFVAWKGGRDAGPTIASLALRSHASAGRQLARAVVRDWLPFTVAGCLCSRRIRRAVLLAWLVDVVAVSRRCDSAPLPIRLGLRAADNAAYAAGLWSGLVSERSLRAAFPAWDRRVSASITERPAGSSAGR